MKELLEMAAAAYDSAATLRSRRRRNKRFTYGDQWFDLTSDARGNRLTEQQLALRSGREPLTNNLIRQLVKTIVGRFRSQIDCSDSGSYSRPEAVANRLAELDTRLMEEFLISGCAVQRIGRAVPGTGRLVENVNPATFFVNAFSDPRMLDVELVGMLHDYSLPQLIGLFSADDPRRASELAALYGYAQPSDGQLLLRGNCQLGASQVDNLSFFEASPGRCRVIEVWTVDSRWMLRCHDPFQGAYFALPSGRRRSVERLNSMRAAAGLPPVVFRQEFVAGWHGRYLTPQGVLLDETVSDLPGGVHPFAAKFYPLIDGEVHSFVEDVIDQQKYVNRLITLIDNIMASSAKGVLLFPESQLSPGISWEQIQGMWAAYNGVIPYSPRPGEPQPHQVVTSGATRDAYQLLSLEMKMFENVSGVSAALQGKETESGTTSANLYQLQTRNSTIALADLFATFADFISMRDSLLHG